MDENVVFDGEVPDLHINALPLDSPGGFQKIEADARGERVPPVR